MLRSLVINNYAIIRHLDIQFQSGLNIITGQTGAGKSIMLGALSLLFGAKATLAALLDDQKNGIIEGEFDITNYNLQSFFNANDIDYSNIISVKRVLNHASGKSRAYISDQPISRDILVAIGAKLIDIHSQHQSLLLSHSDFQIKILDSIAKQITHSEILKKDFKLHLNDKRELKLLLEQAAQTEKEKELLQFQVDEIEEASIKPGEMQTIEEELQKLTHATDIIENLGAANSILDEPDTGALTLLYRTTRHIQNVAKHSDEFQELFERINGCYIELKEATADIDNAALKVELNPTRLELLENRIDTINSLLYKHNLHSEEELVQLSNQISEKLWGLTQNDDRIEQLNKSIAVAQNNLLAQAQTISIARHAAVDNIEKHVIKMLQDLEIKQTQFKVELTKAELSETGIDKVDFLFSANEISAPQPIANVASGGEMARLMLALKALVSKSVNLPTIVFDEIDTGVSGSVANSMGDIIEQMGKTMQVINITHLPQVAAKGINHYYVYKDTETHIKQLTPKEREEHIAEMLSGSKVTEAARKQARELLKNA